MKEIKKKLILNTDGGARGNPGPAGIGAVLTDPQGKILGAYKQYIGHATNNFAEYQALILGLTEAARLGVRDLEVRMDSELVVRQLSGQYKIKNPGLQPLAAQVIALKNNFDSVSFQHIPRNQNGQADELVNLAIDEALEAKTGVSE